MKRLPMTPGNYQAFVDGRKTVTRRLISPQPGKDSRFIHDGFLDKYFFYSNGKRIYSKPFYKPGEKVVVVTRWAAFARFDSRKPSEIKDDYPIFIGNYCSKYHKHRPARFLPLHLEHHFPKAEIISVRAELLQDITDDDAILEGCIDGGCTECGNSEPCKCSNPSPDHVDSFIYLWNSINAKRGYGWHTNPWVWRIEFKKCEP